ncbi:MAG TPA: NADH-quinone oxidoreductase subunit M [Gemmatimonadales bacterium]
MTHVLSTILWLPIAVAVVLALLPQRWTTEIKTIGLCAALIEFVISLTMLNGFRDGFAGMQLVEAKPWIPAWGITYALGVDGISLWLVLLTTLLTPVVFLSSWNAIHKHPKEYVISFLIMEAAMIGVFIATDVVLFYVFFELTLLPMYLVIGVWGGANRIYAAIKFFLFTIFGSLLMLLGIIYIGFRHFHDTGIWSFAVADFYGMHFPMRVETLLFFAFSLAFAIKVPLFPLHTWLPDAHVEAPTAGSVILAGVLLKMGTYGFLRFALPLFPAVALHPAIQAGVVTLALIGIVYGGLVAMVQPDFKKLIAYSSVAHLGFVMLGIWALTLQSVQGALLVMINHGISTGALFFLAGMLYERRHSRLIDAFGGIAKVVPLLAAALTIVSLSSIGLPATNGFVGEFLVLLGAFRTYPRVTIVAASGVIVAAMYLLPALQRVIYNPLDKPENEKLADLTPREIAVLVPLLACIVWIGVYPAPILRRMEPAAKQLIQSVRIDAATFTATR